MFCGVPKWNAAILFFMLHFVTEFFTFVAYMSQFWWFSYLIIYY